MRLNGMKISLDQKVEFKQYFELYPQIYVRVLQKLP